MYPWKAVAVDRSVVVRLIADVNGYTSGMGSAEQATRRVSQEAVNADEAVRTAAAGTEQASRRVAAAKAAEVAAARRVADAERAASGQRAALNAATARTATAERALATARESGTAQQVVAAERGLAAARRAEAVATNASVGANDRLTQAQAARSAAAARTASAERALAVAQREQAAAAATSRTNMAALSSLGSKLALGIGAAVLPLAVMTKTYMGFDAAMSSVKAQLPGQSSMYGQLESSIRAAGRASVFSSTEAAQAAEELAKAGMSAKDIIGGALTGSLNLAAAAGISMADAATYTAQAMSMFHLSAGSASHIADVFANGALSSTADVGTLAQALSQGGLAASQMGVSFDETVGILSMFDQNALKGSDAGTSLKTMLMRLTPSSKEATDAMEQLGLSFYDGTGKFVGMASVAQQLKDKLGPLSDEQRQLAMNTIFGADASRAATLLMGQGAAGVRKWADDVSKSGTAAAVAAQKQNNLRGDIEKLKGAIEDAAIGAGAGADGGFRKLTQWAANAIGVFNKLPDGFKSTGLAVSGVALAMGGIGVLGVKGLNAFRDLRRELTAGRGALRAWSLAAGGSGSIISGLGAKVKNLASSFGAMSTKAKVGATVGTAAFLALGAALTQTGDSQENYGRSTAQVSSDLLTFKNGAVDTSGVFKNLQIAMSNDSSYNFADGLKIATSEASNVGRAIGTLATGFGLFGTGASSDLEATRARLKAVGQALADMVRSGHADQAKAAFDSMAKQANAAGVSTKDLNKVMPDYAAALIEVKNNQKLSAATGKDNADALEAQQKAAEEARKALQDLGSTLLGQIDAEVGYKQALADAQAGIVENGATLDINTEAGRKNMQLLNGLAEAAIKSANATYDQTGSYAAAEQKLNSGRDAYMELAKSMGMPTAQAKEFADQLFKLPSNVKVGVLVPGLPQAVQEVDRFGREVYTVKGTNISVPVSTPNAPQAVQLLTAVKGAQLSADGKQVSIATKTPGAMASQLQLSGIKQAAVSTDGKHVNIPTSALNASGTLEWLNRIGRVATDADGKNVIIPASAPNAPWVNSMINLIHGAQVRADGKKVTISSSAPMAPDTKAKIDRIRGASVSADGKSVTIDTSAPGAVNAEGQILAALRAAQNKTVTITTIYSEKHMSYMDSRLGAAAHSTGGAVFGPGTETSDSIPAWLSHNEHVLDAQDVRNLGGHPAVYTLRRMAAAGWRVPGYATGGAVTKGGVPAYATGGPTWSPDMSGIMSMMQALAQGMSVADARKAVSDTTSALAKARRDLDAARAKYRDVAGRKHTTAQEIAAHNKVADAMDKERKATQALTSARSSLSAVQSRQGLSAGRAFSNAVGSRSFMTKGFLDDIDAISKVSKPLALSLLNQGDDDAVRVAHSYATGPVAEIRRGAAALQFNDQLNTRKDSLVASLSGSVDPSGKAAANAELLAIRGANNARYYATGVASSRPQPVTADPGMIQHIVDQVAKALPVRVVTNAQVVMPNGQVLAEATTAHQDTQSRYGTTMEGLRY